MSNRMLRCQNLYFQDSLWSFIPRASESIHNGSCDSEGKFQNCAISRIWLQSCANNHFKADLGQISCCIGGEEFIWCKCQTQKKQKSESAAFSSTSGLRKVWQLNAWEWRTDQSNTVHLSSSFFQFTLLCWDLFKLDGQQIFTFLRFAFDDSWTVSNPSREFSRVWDSAEVRLCRGSVIF